MSNRPMVANGMPGKRIPLWRKVIYATIPVVALLLVAEFTLALVGVEAELEVQDPFVGFSSQVPLFEEVVDPQGKTWMATRPSKRVWFNHQAFLQNKPSNTRRVFCLGGSTTYGRPFDDSTSFCGWLRTLFSEMRSQQNSDDENEAMAWEWINVGGVSYASYRVAAVMEECLQFEPDLFIVYTGHNEFLEDRTYSDVKQLSPAWMRIQSRLSQFRTYSALRQIWSPSGKPNRESGGGELGPINEVYADSHDGGSVLSAEVDERLNHSIGPEDYERNPVWSQQVENHLAFNVRRMIHLARHANAEIVFVLPASNEKDCAPFKAQSSIAGNQERESAVLSALDIGRNSRSSGNWAAAQEAFAEAVELDPRNAAAQYELGRVLYEQGQFRPAERHLGNAIDEDVCPLRATSHLVTRLQKVLQDESVPLVDFEQRLRELSKNQLGHGVLGREYFLDHVHPTVEAHGMLAQAIFELLLRENVLGTRDFARHLSDQSVGPETLDALSFDWGKEPWKSIYARSKERIEEGIDLRKQGVSLRNLAKVMHWAGKFEEASQHAGDALELLVNDPESRFVLADCLKNLGETERAKSQYEILMVDYPDYARAYLPYGEVLLEVEDYPQALEYLELARFYEPDNAYLHFTFGRLHMQRERWSEALAALRRSQELYPDSDETKFLIQQCERVLSDHPAAAADSN